MMDGLVYFAEAPTGAIKIGFSSDVPRRLNEIHVATGHRLSLLATVPGDRRTESYFHRLHSVDNLIGEWFRPSEPVSATITDVRDRGVSAVPTPYRAAIPDLSQSAPNDDELWETCRHYCVLIAGERRGSEKISDLMDRVSTLTGIKRRVIQMIWYRENGAIKAHIYARLKETFEAREAMLSGGAVGRRAGGR